VCAGAWMFTMWVKRSQGGSDFDLDQLVALCRWCHDQTDAPYERGRLVVSALGDGQFRFELINGTLQQGADPNFCRCAQNDCAPRLPGDVPRTSRWQLEGEPGIDCPVTRSSGLRS
jgi:hypothetical protein